MNPGLAVIMSAWKDDRSAANSGGVNPFLNDEDGKPKLYTQEEEDLMAQIPTIIFYTRVLNLALGVCMIVASVLSLLTTTSATTGVLCCYTIAFACLLCCFESGLQVVLRTIALNCGFMYSAAWRSAFMIFISTILFSFSIFGKVVGILMLVNAAFNVYAIWRYPGYEGAQRDRSMKDIRDYLAENPAFAASFVEAGTAAVVANPALASAVIKGASNNSKDKGNKGGTEDSVPAWAKAGDRV